MAKKYKQRRQFTEEFKQKAVERFEEDRLLKGTTIAEACKRYDVVYSVFHNWLLKYGTPVEAEANGVIVGRRFRVIMLVDTVDDVFMHFAGKAHSIEVETIMLTKPKRSKKAEPELLAIEDHTDGVDDGN